MNVAAMTRAKPSTAGAWILATRPRTLVAGAVPVVVGSALAYRDRLFQWPVAMAALLGALCIQVGTNLTNDYFDFKRGADSSDRQGPARAASSGWLEARDVLAGAMISFALATVFGVYLVWVGGVAILAIGLASIVAGYCYTGGPYPLAYHGLGDVFVLAFFGFVAVGGTYFVQTGTLSALSLVAAVAVGLQGVMLLAVNNTRDVESDRRSNKKTLVVKLGQRFGRIEYVVCFTFSALTPVALWLSGAASPWVLTTLFSLPLTIHPLRLMLTVSDRRLNTSLAETARFQMVFGLLFAFGLAQ